MQAINMQLREENKNLKEKVQMFDRRLVELEKKLEIFSKSMSLPKKRFNECQDSLTTIMADWDKSKV